MKIELLYFDGCPNYEAFLPRLRGLLEDRGIKEAVKLRRVGSDQEAQSERFLGSPTIRVDGEDVEPAARDRADFGLKCRLYMTEAGLRGAPPDELIAKALDR